MTPRTLAAAIVTSFVLFGAAQAADQGGFQSQMGSLAKTWAHVNYEIRDPHAEAAEARALASRASALAAQYPERAQPLAWQALAILSEADALHDLKSLELVRSARHLLERAARMDPDAIGPGSIYANLGSLYAQVPGFPLSFGDPRKARVYFEKALAADPDGLDANYFYADYLYRQEDAPGAIRALERALAAPPRPGCELADRGRKWEASQLLAKIRRKQKPDDGRTNEASLSKP